MAVKLKTFELEELKRWILGTHFLLCNGIYVWFEAAARLYSIPTPAHQVSARARYRFHFLVPETSEQNLYFNIINENENSRPSAGNGKPPDAINLSYKNLPFRLKLEGVGAKYVFILTLAHPG